MKTFLPHFFECTPVICGISFVTFSSFLLPWFLNTHIAAAVFHTSACWRYDLVFRAGSTCGAFLSFLCPERSDLTWMKDFQFPSWRDLRFLGSPSLLKNTVIWKVLLDFIQTLFASFACFELKLLEFVFQILLSFLHLLESTLIFIKAALEFVENLIPNCCAHFVGSSFQSFKTRSPGVEKLFCLLNRPVSRFWFLFLFLSMFSPFLSFAQFLTRTWVGWNIRCSKLCLLKLLKLLSCEEITCWINWLVQLPIRICCWIKRKSMV